MTDDWSTSPATANWPIVVLTGTEVFTAIDRFPRVSLTSQILTKTVAFLASNDHVDNASTVSSYEFKLS